MALKSELKLNQIRKIAQLHFPSNIDICVSFRNLKALKPELKFNQIRKTA